jgi:hypothetical protein
MNTLLNLTPIKSNTVKIKQSKFSVTYHIVNLDAD